MYELSHYLSLLLFMLFNFIMCVFVFSAVQSTFSSTIISGRHLTSYWKLLSILLILDINSQTYSEIYFRFTVKHKTFRFPIRKIE